MKRRRCRNHKQATRTTPLARTLRSLLRALARVDVAENGERTVHGTLCLQPVDILELAEAERGAKTAADLADLRWAFRDDAAPLTWDNMTLVPRRGHRLVQPTRPDGVCIEGGVVKA